jgi:hypothetical protein
VAKWLEKYGVGMESTTPLAHYQNGVSEWVNRAIREKAAPLIQETTTTGQITAILSEKGTELLRESRIPESLWPEAIEHAVWLKNLSPARALRRKRRPLRRLTMTINPP